MLPSRTISSPPAATTPSTPTHYNLLFPRTTDPPSAETSCPPNTLVVQLTTALVIPDYKLYFPQTPIESYTPKYAALPDSSLLTPAFSQDMADASLSLLIIGALSTLFVRNIILSGDYLRRARIEKMSLFYLLFTSQLLGIAGLVPIIASYFSQAVNCTAVLISACVSGATSLGILITGILGVKAYRCMENPRWLIVVLAVFQAGMVAMVILDVIATVGARRLTGSCTRTSELLWVKCFVTIQFVESLFLCGCFLYVCWKSRNSPAARGRVSLSLSMDDFAFEKSDMGRQSDVRSVQEQNAPPKAVQPVLNKTTPDERANSTRSSNRSRLRNYQRRITAPFPEPYEPRRRVSLAPSSISRLSKFIPRMELFYQVMKDELFYTTFITSSCVAVAVLSVIGVNFKNGLSVVGWIVLNWSIISFFAIHSFGRVVRRHEREALLNHPRTCVAITQAANELAERRLAFRASRIHRPLSEKTSLSSMDVTEDPNDPFGDQNAPYVVNPFQDSSEATSPSGRPRSPSWRNIRFSILEGSLPSTPVSQDFPTSSPATPIVPVDPTRSVGGKGFSGSLLSARNSASSSGGSMYSNRSSQGALKPSGSRTRS